ncbi:hypothetical protein HZL39_05280 [Lactiplantibacillus plantarum]|nr:YopX family protein [Lactiplantibacillus plantarum]UJL24470.1 hypothetical protein HZL39_05280 [Lactiplantibacillus plantarum]
MATMIKFRAWNKATSSYRKVLEIEFYPDGELKKVKVAGLQRKGTITPDNLVLEQFTGLKDANGKEIYEGNILQPVISYTKRNIGKPFEVKKGNYVYGKWIAKDVSSKEFGVDGYYFSNEMRLIGNVHANPELLEEKK